MAFLVYRAQDITCCVFFVALHLLLSGMETYRIHAVPLVRILHPKLYAHRRCRCLMVVTIDGNVVVVVYIFCRQ